MTQRAACAAAFPTDQVGKVFIVLAIQGMRRCLVCDHVFTRPESAEHANVVYWPEKRSSWLISAPERERRSLTGFR